MEIKPGLVHNILLTMGRLQGLKRQSINEEEPGKIIHEYRNKQLGGLPIETVLQRISPDIKRNWKGGTDEMAYYGSVDATPHFLRVLDRFGQAYGDEILDETVERRDGEPVTMREVARQATAWLTGKLAVSKSGLVEYHRLNPHGIVNQVWKDSAEFYVHEDGKSANHDAPIASIEVQGLAYDGLLAAARFFPEQAAKYRQAAEELRDRTIELLWQESDQYFAVGCDYGSTGKLRVINTSTANPAALLDTGFFDNLKGTEREKYITGIVSTIMGNDFLTGAGIRSRALSTAHLVDFWDYHGSFVSWPKETYDIAKGLRRQGFPTLSRQLENRLLNIVLKAHEYPEFVYVDEWGRVLAGAPSKRPRSGQITVSGRDKPERIQAWTVSAIMAILTGRLRHKRRQAAAPEQTAWQIDLEEAILDRIPHVDRYVNPLKLLWHYPTYKYALRDKPA